MNSLCLIYNLAPKYRECIFLLIDKTYNCKWYFGDNDTDIKKLDPKILSNATFLKNIRICGNWYWQKGTTKLCNQQDYSTFLITGDPYCISTWILAIKIRLFYPKKHLYFWSHGWSGKESKLVGLIKKVFFKLANGVFLYGDYAKQLMEKKGFHSSRLFVIHNSLNHKEHIEIRKELKPSDIYSSYFNNNNPVLVFIGRLTAIKRLDMLIYAAKQMKDVGIPVNLVFVGDGVMHDNLAELVSSLGLNKFVWFYGACYDDYKNAELIYNADLCVAPGNVGLTAIHAMSFGTPIITHNNFPYQMPEFEAILEGKTGAFFEYGNVESLVETIRTWITKKQNNRTEIRQACFDEIDNNWTPQFQINVIRENLKL